MVQRTRAAAALLLLGLALSVTMSGGSGCGIAVNVVDDGNANAAADNVNDNDNTSIDFDFGTSDCRGLCCGCDTTSVARSCETATDSCLLLPDGATRQTCFEDITTTYIGLCGN